MSVSLVQPLKVSGSNTFDRVRNVDVRQGLCTTAESLFSNTGPSGDVDVRQACATAESTPFTRPSWGC